MDYKSTRWKKLRERVLRRDKYLCRESARYGRMVPAAVVHHVWPAALYPEYAWCEWNLISLSTTAHNAMHNRETDALTELGEAWRRRTPPPHPEGARLSQAGTGEGTSVSNRAGFVKNFLRGGEGKMAAPATTKATIKKQTVQDMKKLGVYRPEYDRIVDIYAGLVEQYHRLMLEYDKKPGYCYATGTGAAGEKKSPLVSTIEGVRRDILAYSDRLCINPRAEREGKQPAGRQSKLEDLLRGS